MTGAVSLSISDSITSLHGVGPKKAKALEKLKIRTIEDFLSYYPRDYQDRRHPKPIKELVEDETALICGKISLMVRGGYRGRKRTLKLLVTDETGGIEVIFFNASYLEKTFNREKEYEFYGKVTSRAGRLQMLHPEYNQKQPDEQGEILPVYPLTQGITQSDFRKWQRLALSYIDEIVDYMPEDIISRNRLCSLRYAIENIHFPKDSRKVREARFRLVFDELFLLQLGLLSIKYRIKENDAGIAFSTEHKTRDFVRALPFELTGAQKRVLDEIEKDMEESRVMNRLVQGDVGSGKTVVAAAAAYKAIKCGYQAVMMAPTELLARQHYDSLKGMFEGFNINVGLLTGSMTKLQRTKIYKQVEDGTIHFLIGTHALIQPEVKYFNVGLVITDEQHRFGVNQRSLLSAKGHNPDVLVMTATPIPRTLAVILYGDLDHSAIDEMPAGRKPILTKALSEKSRNKAYEFLRSQVKEGRQAYIVTPLIEESENIDAKSAEQVYEEALERFPEFEVRLLHGNMKQSEKDVVMEEFYSGKADILVSTVVIEVGINVPNATVMLIENAERFGLAALHQLRGRVGRGEHQSYCLLITDTKSELAKERAAVMEQTNDGFAIAEKDLELRGPGEFFGVRQHGVPELRIADLSKHLRILHTVRKEADSLLEKDPFLSLPEHRPLKEKLGKLFENTNIINL
ncbi:MAG TPA: ATP-dependent DNA helicase RecG [Bacillota bacterium]|nr:ATP-dependent DNA helicase RecG [Bacillota bacterium]